MYATSWYTTFLYGGHIFANLKSAINTKIAPEEYLPSTTQSW